MSQISTLAATTAASAEFQSTLTSYEAAVAHNDVESISSFLDESFVQTYPTGKVVNKREHLDALRSMQASLLSMEKTDCRLLCYPSFVVVVVGIRLAIGSNGREHTMQVRATQVWRQVPSGWSCVAIHSSFEEQ